MGLSRQFRILLKHERGDKCEQCGKPLKRKFHIHHKDSKGYGYTSQPDDNRKNLMVVCVKCHLLVCHDHWNTARPRKDAALPWDKWVAWVRGE